MEVVGEVVLAVPEADFDLGAVGVVLDDFEPGLAVFEDDDVLEPGFLAQFVDLGGEFAGVNLHFGFLAGQIPAGAGMTVEGAGRVKAPG